MIGEANGYEWKEALSWVRGTDKLYCRRPTVSSRLLSGEQHCKGAKILTTDRAENVADVVAVETVAPDMVRVVSWSDEYVVDARSKACECKDKQYNLAPDEPCKHHYAAMLAMSDRYPSPCIVSDNLRGTQEITL